MLSIDELLQGVVVIRVTSVIIISVGSRKL